MESQPDIPKSCSRPFPRISNGILGFIWKGALSLSLTLSSEQQVEASPPGLWLESSALDCHNSAVWAPVPCSNGPASSSITSHTLTTLARVWPKSSEHRVSLADCCHVLLFYGLGPTDLPVLTSGSNALQVLTEEDAALRILGESPFIRTRNGLRYFLLSDPFPHTNAESHRDQCLATFAKLNLPLSTPITLHAGHYSIRHLLLESTATFRFDQGELAWSALAFARYLPPQKEWSDRFGRRTSLSQLASALISQNLAKESCFGIHLLDALLYIEHSDYQYNLLETQTRKAVSEYISQLLGDIVTQQRPDGSWSTKWCSHAPERLGNTANIKDTMLVTGHLLAVLKAVSYPRSVPAVTCARAATWVRRSIASSEIRDDGLWLCPFTHAVAAARDSDAAPLEHSFRTEPDTRQP